ncbi:MAG: site-specific DNA-methyltransferase [Candidatus Peregrinibacteria bacterium]
MSTTPITIGDTFALGEHRLLCADSRDAAAIKPFLAGQKVSLILSDPPYGVAYVEGKEAFTKKSKTAHAPIANDQLQTREQYKKFTKVWLDAVRPFLAKKNAAYIFGSDTQLFAMREGIEDAGFHFGQMLFWLKTAGVLSRLDYLPAHELIFYAWHGTHEFRKSKESSILLCPKPARSKAHPTMKPMSLVRRLILNSSKTEEVVYDAFLGSGTTLLACEQTRRKCFGVEIDPHYCQVIIDRFEKATGIKAVKLSSPISHG